MPNRKFFLLFTSSALQFILGVGGSRLLYMNQCFSLDVSTFKNVLLTSLTPVINQSINKYLSAYSELGTKAYTQ